MNELRRMAYLEAMGIDSYVSRSQLSGAAATRRLVIVPSRPAVSEAAALPRQAGASLTRLESAPRNPAPVKPVMTPVSQSIAVVPRFSLAAIVAGGWLWLEELEGMPLAREQVQLVQAMARALAAVTAAGEAGSAEAGPRLAGPRLAGPLVAQFDWPIHNNQQLELGEDAARASVAGFIGRKLEQHQCRGLVLLGPQCKTRVPLEQLDNALVGTTVSSAAMLADPRLKQQAWQVLLSLSARA